jgi:3-phosphoshikimate 1-carboxyvinyltransferase
MKISFISLPQYASVQLPTSKSITNRVLLIQALCQQHLQINNISNSDDSIAMQDMLASNTMIVNANEAGTALRLMTAFYCMHQQGTTKIITCAPRLRQRPIADLVQALQSIGADISYADKEGFAPLKIKSVNNLQNNITIDANISSQFISALCLIAPCLPNGLHIQLLPPITSLPYIHMTLGLMNHFEVASSFTDNQIHILPQQYIAKAYTVEADWSAATFIYSALMLLPNGSIFIADLQLQSIQGDAFMYQLAAQFGITSAQQVDGIRINKTSEPIVPAQIIDLNAHPDLAIPFIVVCALQYPQIQITGLQTLLVKESNRIEALQTELAKVGIKLNYTNNALSFSGNLQTTEPVIFDTYQDHRIAMALALVAIMHPNISINNTEVVSKSFPEYWHQLQVLGFVIE